MDLSYSVPDEFKGDEDLAELFSSDEDVSAFTHTAPLSAYISPAIRAELSCTPHRKKSRGYAHV